MSKIKLTRFDKKMVVYFFVSFILLLIVYSKIVYGDYLYVIDGIEGDTKAEITILGIIWIIIASTTSHFMGKKYGIKSMQFRRKNS